MAAYHQVDGLKSPAGWLPVQHDQLRAQRSAMSMGELYLYLFMIKLPDLSDWMPEPHMRCQIPGVRWWVGGETQLNLSLIDLLTKQDSIQSR